MQCCFSLQRQVVFSPIHTSTLPHNTLIHTTQKLQLQRIVGVSHPTASAIAYHPTQLTTLAYTAGSLILLRDVCDDSRPARIMQNQVPPGEQPKPIRCLAFCPTGRWLAAGEEGRSPGVLMFDLEAAQAIAGEQHPVRVLKRHKYTITSVRFSSDGMLIALYGFCCLSHYPRDVHKCHTCQIPCHMPHTHRIPPRHEW